MNEVFTAASHDELLRLVVQVAVLLLAARGLAYVARRLDQPAVIGEILAGILLGPSLLAGVWPEGGAWIVPEPGVEGYLLETIGFLGALFLMLATGLETDLALIRRHARTAIGVSWGGVLLSFGGGFALAKVLPDFLLVDADARVVFAMFLGTTFAISAIPVIAKVLIDLGLMRRDIGQTIIAAGMSDDTIGWILLSVVVGLAAGEAIDATSITMTVGGILIFIVLSFTAGQWMVRRLITMAQDRRAGTDGLVTLVVGLMFLWAAITQAMHFEAVLGAFVIGIILGQMHTLPAAVHDRISTLSMGIFTPIFFGIVGLKVDLAILLEPELLQVTVAVILVSTIAKVGGTFMGARIIGGKEGWNALAYGAGLNAGGAMKILVATIGLQNDVITHEMFSILVVMAIVTTFATPFALRGALRRITPAQEELERLRREELAAGSMVSSIRRVLLPIRQRHTPGLETLEAKLLSQIGRGHPFSVTLMNVCEPGERQGATRFLSEISDVFKGMDVHRRVVESRDVEQAVGDEAHKYYDMMVLGAPERSTHSEVLFNPLVDLLVRTAPCPTLVVKSASEPKHWPPRRILVPTNGSKASRRAAELAFALVGNGEGDGQGEPGDSGDGSHGVQVFFLQVATEDSHTLPLESREERLSQRVGTMHHMVEGLAQEATDRGLHASGEVRLGADPESVILEYAKHYDMDLILLGTGVRPGSHRLFLGPRVEWVLEHAECPVVVLNV